MTPPSPEAAAHPHRWAMLFGAWSIYFCFGLITAATAPLVGPISRDLDLSASEMGSVFGAWQLVYIVSAIPCGALLDRMGPRRAIAAAGVIIALSGAWRALAGGWLDLFLAVALFGIGGPLISIGAPKVIALWFEGAERGLAMGVYITGPALGNIAALSLTNAVVMPLLGGDWRAVTMVYAAAALLGAAVWAAVSAHPASRAMERRMADEPARSQLAVFGELARLPAVQAMLAIGLGVFFINHGFMNWLPEMLRSHGFAPSEAGFWASLPVAAGIAGSLLIPRFATPPRRLPILLALFVAAGVASQLLHATAIPILALGLALQGVARGAMMTVAVLTLLELRHVGARNAGAASGLFFSAAEIGGVLGPIAIGVSYDMTGGFEAGLDLLCAVAATLVVLALLFRSLQR